MPDEKQLIPAPCAVCKKESLLLWAASYPAICGPLCPACFRAERNTSSFTLFFGEPMFCNGAWAQRQDIEFRVVARALEDSLSWLIQSRVRRDGVAPPPRLTTKEESIEKGIFLLYDYTHDPTWIPHWKSQIEFIDGQIHRENPTGGMLGELLNRIAFFEWRITETMLPAEGLLGLRQQRELNRLKRMLSAWKAGTVFTESESPLLTVNWELLAPAGDGWSQIVAYNDSLEQFKHVERDDNRLLYLHEETPDMRFVGRSGFDGYVGFIFHRSSYVLLESAFVGNALYALPSNEWRELSKLSKTELRARPDVIYVIHPDDKIKWIRNLGKHLLRWKIRD